MKILQIVQKPQLRGAEIFAHGLCGKLRNLGHETATVYLHPPDSGVMLPARDGDRILEGDTGSLMKRVLGVSPHLLRGMKEAIREFGPDVVQVNGGSTVKYGAFAKRFSRDVKWVLVYRNIGDPREWVRSPLQRAYYRHMIIPAMDGIVSVSRECLAAVLAMYGTTVPSRNIPRGVDPESFCSEVSHDAFREEAGCARETPVLITVGSLSSEKRVDRILRVLIDVKKKVPDAVLWIVGEGPQRSTLERMVQTMGLDSSVRFFGVREDVASCLNAADMFLLASDTEGIPGVILEAGLMGLATVATKVGGVPECIVAGETGLMVEPVDEQGFVRDVVALLQDCAGRETMGNLACHHIRERFSLDRIAGEYLEFYREVITSLNARG